MKNTLMILLLFTFICINAYPQSYAGNGKIILNSGEELVGKVAIELYHPDEVAIGLSNREIKNFNTRAVKEFYIEDKHYFTIKIPVIGNTNTFAYLISKEGYKIRLFRYEQSDLSKSISTEIYVLFEGEQKAYTLDDFRVHPFSKVSKFVQSCPELAKKIADKQEGYTLPNSASTDEFIELYKKVAEEYQNCN